MDGCSAWILWQRPGTPHLARRSRAVCFAVLVGMALILSSSRAREQFSASKDSRDATSTTDSDSHDSETDRVVINEEKPLDPDDEDRKEFYRRQDEDGDGDGDTCKPGGKSKENECAGTPQLFRLEGEKVGHVQNLELVPGRTYELKTVNMKPVIFEILDFFTSDECNHIISLAMEQGLKTSATTSSGDDNVLSLLDVNGDQKLSIREMQLTLEDGYDIYLDDEDVKTMYAELGVDVNNDDFLSRQEVTKKVITKIASYIKKLQKENPIKKSRFSEQTWIYPDQIEDPLVASFQDRISKLTQLPQALIDKFSYFQVVHYGKHGHYNAHHDSSFIDDTTCCHLTKSKKCRICRFMTIMVYLNDVEEGGETAFPVANNDTYSTHAFRQTGMMNLNARCQESNLKVQPKQGKAVIWYNHFINETTGWIGDIDPFTWHGGCPVTKGHKWIMNRWISVSNSREVDLTVP